MSELDDIVAAAGIVIVESAPSDGGDTGLTGNQGVEDGNAPSIQSYGDASTLNPVEALESMFSYRYTMDDPDYAQTVADAEYKSSPPLIPNFKERRNRERGGRQGNWGGRGGGYNRGGRGGYHDNRRQWGGQQHQDRRNNYDGASYGHQHWNNRDGGDNSNRGRQDHYRNQNRERDY